MIPLDAVLQMQMTGGAFAAELWLEGRPRADANAVATALVLDALGGFRDDPRAGAEAARALDFLAACADAGAAPAFFLRPAGDRPAAPEADATALAALALHDAGRLARGDLAAILARRLRPFRLDRPGGAEAPWQPVGAFQSWLDPMAAPNPVDCTVNVNLLCLIHAAGGPEREVAAILDMLEGALGWAGATKARIRRLSPLYAEPVELVHALGRAARRGVPGVGALHRRLLAERWVEHDLAHPEGLPIRAGRDGHDGRARWTCAALEALRARAIGLFGEIAGAN